MTTLRLATLLSEVRISMANGALLSSASARAEWCLLASLTRIALQPKERAARRSRRRPHGGSYYIQSPIFLAGMNAGEGTPFAGTAPPAAPMVVWGLLYPLVLLGAAVLTFGRRDL
jgi:hypothetical protein